jgi:hypothetical protein
MRPVLGIRSSLALTLTLSLIAACGSESHDRGGPGPKVEPGLAPRLAVDEPRLAPEPELEPEPAPEPAPEPDPEPDPVVAERKLALASVGRPAFEALQAGDFEAFAALTPLLDGPLRDVCSRMPLSKRAELEARFAHCHRSIAWDAVVEAQIFAGTPSGEQALGCDAGIEDYGRLQLFLHMSDATFKRVDFYGAVGQGGKPIGLNGEVSCRTVDEVPKL